MVRGSRLDAVRHCVTLCDTRWGRLWDSKAARQICYLVESSRRCKIVISRVGLFYKNGILTMLDETLNYIYLKRQFGFCPFTLYSALAWHKVLATQEAVVPSQSMLSQDILPCIIQNDRH